MSVETVTPIDFLHNFLELVRKKYPSGVNSPEEAVDYALARLLRANKDVIAPMITSDTFYYTGEFQKLFRQCDVCKDGDTDMAIYHLIDQSEYFRTEFANTFIKRE